MESFLYFALIGLCAGWLAGQLTQGGGFGIWGNLIIGVIGAILGGWLFALLGFGATNLLGQLVTATVGAIVLLFILSKVAPKV
jgi:uncharacterized membrane protein YeaQ/YmgE (transglycosylase-associated protein family)